MSLKLLAVSGGIDSMVMMDFLSARFPAGELLVVTVDHGMRESSAADAEFVRRVAGERYGLRCEVARLELGEGVSEAEARAARYAALEGVGQKVSGGELGVGFEILVAQHLDDLAESIAINCLRGTGWRGLAAMGRAGVRRPFLDLGFFDGPVDKRWILRYAARRRVVWREDPTNASDDYLRNRIRPEVRAIAYGQKFELYKRWRAQRELGGQVDDCVCEILAGQEGLPREWFYEMDDGAADEILRGWLGANGLATTRLQRADFLRAIREYPVGKLFNLPGGKLVKIGKVIHF